MGLRYQGNTCQVRSLYCTFLTLFITKGTTQITSVDSSGRNYIANAVCHLDFTKCERASTTDSQGPGDLWYFPAGVPHSLQATADDPDGSEFLLVRLASHKYYLIPLIFASRSSLMVLSVMSRHSWRVFSTLKNARLFIQLPIS